MTPAYCWGIFREREHSPGRETDDTEILRLTAKHLEAAGFQVRLKTPEEVMASIDPPPSAVFLMCERLGILELLCGWEALGIRQVNRPAAVLNTYRERMITQFQQAMVPFISSQVVATGGPQPTHSLPVWVKRADVHNTQDGDVVFAPTPSACGDALAALAARGIERAVVQPHQEGDLIKFYGVGVSAERRRPRPAWFRWFYHRDQRASGHPVDPAALAKLIQGAADALGLEIYGGDAIATAHGLILLDVNAWPSFALYREEAAAAIATCLRRRFRERD